MSTTVQIMASVGAAGLLAIISASPARSQLTGCATGDAGCLAAQAVYNAVAGSHSTDGLLEYAVGTLCGDDQVKARGRAKYDTTLVPVTQTARNSLLAAGLSNAAAYPYMQALPAMVKVARTTEATGILAGLRSSFAMYPGSKSEYCSRMKASITH